MKKVVNPLCGVLLICIPVSVLAVEPYTIVVEQAIYGNFQDNKVCDVTNKVKSLCEGLKTCSVGVFDTLCSTGDPAPGEQKALSVNYSCGKEGKYSYTNEGGIAVLSCENLSLKRSS